MLRAAQCGVFIAARAPLQHAGRRGLAPAAQLRVAQHASRRPLSTSASTPAATAERASLRRAAAMARTPIVFEPQAAAGAAAVLKDKLGLPAGSRTVVACTTSGTRRGALVTHFLRRAGFFPLQIDLPDGYPDERAVQMVVDAAKRTGATSVVGVGSSGVISIGRLAAAQLANPGKPRDFCKDFGGAKTFERPSVPFLAVPTCPAGSELLRVAPLVVQGSALVKLTVHAASPQAVVVDPALAVSLQPAELLATAAATAAHCLEAYLRFDSTAATRSMAYEGLQRVFLALAPALRAPAAVGWRSQLATASLLASACMSQGPLGAIRGLSQAVSTRYKVPYATAASAVTPGVLGATLEACLERYDAETGGEVAQEVGDEVARGSARGSGEEDDEEEEDDSATAASLAEGGQHTGPRRGVKPSKIRSSFDLEEAGSDDRDLVRMLAPNASPALEDVLLGHLRAGRGDAVAPAEAEASDAGVTLLRLVRVGALLKRSQALAAAAASADAAAAAAAITASAPSWSDTSALRDIDADAVEQLPNLWQGWLTAAAKGCTSPSVAAAGGLKLPSLRHVGWSDADLIPVSEAAEVSEDGLANVMPLPRKTLVEILKDAP